MSEERKPRYYDIGPLLSKNATYNMLLGERANGKSYQCKLYALTRALEGHKFVYLRRWQADITAKTVESYFADMPIKKITKNKFDTIVCYAGFIYFGVTDSKGSVKRAMEIGRACDLNDQIRYKSQAFPDYDLIIYEEFISNGLYITDEPRELFSFISTVARHDQVQVLLVGNTISRVCPYFSYYSLDSSILKMKPGQIDVYHWHTEDDTTIDIAVEYCQSANAVNKMFFGRSQKQVVGTEWDTFDYPVLPRTEHELVYSVILEYQKFKFMLQLMVENVSGGAFVHIYPCTTDRMTERVISDKFNVSPLYSIDFNVNCKPIIMIKDLIDRKKVCFSDNLTGTDFYTILGQMGCA